MTLTYDIRGKFKKKSNHRNGMVTSAMTLNLGVQGQILKKSYLRNGMADWQGQKGMWLSTLTSPMTLTLDFQGQIFE